MPKTFHPLVVALIGLFTLASVGQAQENRLPSLLKAGYSRPGSPADPTVNGKIVQLALKGDPRLKVIGGTVYFAVFERTGTPGDPWGLGTDLSKFFMPGKDAKDVVSPLLESKSRYLYLYQIVNDRGMEPQGVVFAAPADPKSEPIGGFDLRLPVDTKYITSWGYFEKTGMSVLVNETPAGAVAPAGQGKGAEIRLAVSAAGSVLDLMPRKPYEPKSPAHSLMDINSTLRIGPSTLNLDKSASYQGLQKRELKGVALVGSEKNFLEAVKAAREPNLVQLLPRSEKDTGADLRVTWKADNAIKLGQHSVIFGFTSDLAPANEAAYIEAPGAKADAARPVVDGEIAQATLPAPMPPVNAANASKARTPILAGFTRPGNPPDEVTPQGKILPIAYKAGYKRKVLGGTVYFAVFERTGADDDAWSTGFPKLNESFSEGYSFKGAFSPHLDTRAKYLYLYQIVNDRGMEKPVSGEIATAALDEKQVPNIDNIAAYLLRLSVDPRYITSWGHFKNAAFTVQVPNRTRTGEVMPAADGAGDSKISFAVSSYEPILAEIPVKRYANRSPAFPLPSEMVNMFGVGSATLNLKIAEQHKQLAEKRAEGATKLVGYENNILNAAVSARNPDFVQIMYGTNEEVPGLQGTSYLGTNYQGMGEIGPVVFRADFRNPLLAGQHSVVFGFTTDLPPQDEPINIEDIVTARQGAGAIRAVADGDGTAPGTGTGIAPAAGVAPGPIAPAAFGGGGGGGGGAVGGGMGGIGMGGFGGGGFGGPIAGGIGAPPAGATGGGGGLLGGGGNGKQAAGTTTTSGASTGTTNNFNLTNQQQQQQQQQQSNTNTNTNTNTSSCGCHNNHHGQVVPEPASFVLAMLGIPGFWWLVRRKRIPSELPLADGGSQG